MTPPTTIMKWESQSATQVQLCDGSLGVVSELPSTRCTISSTPNNAEKSNAEKSSHRPMNKLCDNNKSFFQEITEVCSKKHIKINKYSLYFQFL